MLSEGFETVAVGSEDIGIRLEKAATQARAQALRALREPYRIFYYKAGRGTDLCTTRSGISLNFILFGK